MINGVVAASGAPGQNTSTNTAGGGGAGGGIWVSAQTVELAVANVLNLSGRPGGTANNNTHGGDGALRLSRIPSLVGDEFQAGHRSM